MADVTWDKRVLSKYGQWESNLCNLYIFAWRKFPEGKVSIKEVISWYHGFSLEALREKGSSFFIIIIINFLFCIGV